jgi:hypothetical protein
LFAFFIGLHRQVAMPSLAVHRRNIRRTVCRYDDGRIADFHTFYYDFRRILNQVGSALE